LCIHIKAIAKELLNIIRRYRPVQSIVKLCCYSFLRFKYLENRFETNTSDDFDVHVTVHHDKFV
jgi:hypothetical protein